ncbi:MAG TPA: hypothetical protein PLQ76_02960, partial [bacterium]|nr:hypothetical protein [bacterium]
KVEAWVNGEKADLKEESGERQSKVALKSGANSVVLKIASRRFPRFSIRFSDTDDKSIGGLAYSL